MVVMSPIDDLLYVLVPPVISFQWNIGETKPTYVSRNLPTCRTKIFNPDFFLSQSRNGGVKCTCWLQAVDQPGSNLEAAPSLIITKSGS